MLTTSINLLERVRHLEDHAAWERFVGLYSPLLLRWACRTGLPTTEAIDFVQDVLIILLQELPSFQYEPNRGTFRGWLKTLTYRNLTLRRGEWNPAANSVGRPTHVAASEDAAAFMEEQEYQDFLVRRALEIMKSDFAESTWRACWMHTVGGQTAADVGRQLGMSEGAVYVAKGRVLRRLREEMRGLIE